MKRAHEKIERNDDDDDDSGQEEKGVKAARTAASAATASTGSAFLPMSPQRLQAAAAAAAAGGGATSPGVGHVLPATIWRSMSVPMNKPEGVEEDILGHEVSPEDSSRSMRASFVRSSVMCSRASLHFRFCMRIRT